MSIRLSVRPPPEALRPERLGGDQRGFGLFEFVLTWIQFFSKGIWTTLPQIWPIHENYAYPSKDLLTPQCPHSLALATAPLSLTPLPSLEIYMV